MIPNKEHYEFKRYVHLGRWVSYWHQIQEVLKTDPENVVIVGKGDGLVELVLKQYVQSVQALDIETSLRPDIVASVLDIPLTNSSIDTVLCAEVLEHLPFTDFPQALSELKRVAKNYCILSLPHFGPPIKFLLKTPYLPELNMALKLPVPLNHTFDGEHYWEIGKRGYDINRIRGIIKQYFKINREFVPFENQYHHFFILQK